MRRGCLRAIIASLLAAIVFGASTSPAGAAISSEYELKAIFLLNFARFNNWPTSALPPGDTPLVVGVLGTDPFGNFLDIAFHGEDVAGHPLQIRRFSRRDDYKNCHLLFICRSESSHLPQIISAVSGRHVLTVSDIDQFVYKDGMIGMQMEQNRVKVQVNYDKARSENLELSAKLLKVSFVLRSTADSMIHSYTNEFGFPARRLRSRGRVESPITRNVRFVPVS